MKPINELPVGTFCRFDGSVVYIYKNNFDDVYGVFPIGSVVPTDKSFNHKVLVYKKPKKEWVKKAREWLEDLFEEAEGQTIKDGFVLDKPAHIDNLLYIENLDILKSYDNK